MDTDSKDKTLADLANAFIVQANEQLTTGNHTKVSMALLIAAARFNAHIIAAGSGSIDALKAEMPKAVSYFTKKYERSLKDSLTEYSSAFEADTRQNHK